MKNHHFHQQLTEYSALAGSLLSAQAVNAQIIYTDLHDVQVNAANPVFYLDLNGDGIVDYTLRYYNLTFAGRLDQRSLAFLDDSWMSAMGNHNHVFAASWYDAGRLSFGDEIGPNLNWGSVFDDMAFVRYFYGSGGLGEWLGGVHNGYAGLKFEINGEVHYAWLRVDVMKYSKDLIIKDYAYQSTPYTPIKAGNKGTGISNHEDEKNTSLHEASSLRVFPDPVSRILTVAGLNAATEKYDFTILNMQGEIVRQIPGVIANESITVDVHDLAAGLYVLQAKDEKGLQVRKLFVKK